tara:strand:+ start:6179 stop:7117 length:939 start_codon:yes stop_codon:yes gene_type:complete
MKLFETHFEEYIKEVTRFNLHKDLKKIYDKFPSSIEDMSNIIFYGPAGVGKYSQMLYSIQKYSPTELRYEKKMCINYLDKSQYFLKISDIHYEVDMSILGCNAKTLWNCIYYQIMDSITTKQIKKGIIVCKNFHTIHSELLEIFYNYMNHSKNIIFIFVTENIGFIPNNIIQRCKVISIAKPTKTHIKQCFSISKHRDVDNLKYLKMTDITSINYHEKLCNEIVCYIIDYKNIDFLRLRELLYDIFIYQHNIDNCIWYITSYMINHNYFCKKTLENYLIKLYQFYVFFNNNYRPIYHLENLMLYLCSSIHGL